jgi:hypothetical protein
MPVHPSGRITAQQAALLLNTTSAEVCRLVSIGRLHGKKQKQQGRPGTAQWTISPASVNKEVRRVAKMDAESLRRRNGKKRA